jgi:L-iditol 2-dehydrogenase
MYKGNHPVIRPPIVLGHEVVGRLIEVSGSLPDGFSLDSRVAFLPQVGCGHCEACRRNDARLCSQMKLIGGQIPGGMADSLVIPADNLIAVPDTIPSELQVLVEPLAVAVHAVGRAPVYPDDDCLILGSGPIGALLGFMLRERGAKRIVMIDPDERRRAMMAYFGFEVADAVPDQNGHYDLVFECVGGAKPAEAALAAARAAGHIVLVGVAAATLTLSGVQLQRQERTVTGSHMYTRTEFAEAFALLAKGVVPHDSQALRRLIEVRPLSDVSDVMAALDRRAVAALKVVLVP